MPDQEKERLERIRQQQISSRDPGPSKIKGYDWDKHRQKKMPKKRPFPLSEWDVLSKRLRGMIIGFLIGLLMAIPMLLFLQGEWQLMAIVPVLVSMVVGMVIGSLFDEKIK